MATQGKLESGKYLELLAVAVASGSQIRDAADACGCSHSHAYHLSSSPEFKSRVAELRSEISANTVGKMTQAASKAADTLHELLDESNDPPIRLNAAKAILASVGPMAELGELRARIDALEKQAGKDATK